MTDGDFNNFDPNDSKDLWVLENIKNIVIDSINKINLDLSNLTVLTEAATGSWSFTPIIAGLAQAESIICITKDSKYGDSTQIIKNFSKLSKYFGIENKIQIHKNLLPATIKKADIITNSGFVRPIEKKFINLLKPTAVISLMWEPWEYREKDLDLSDTVVK